MMIRLLNWNIEQEMWLPQKWLIWLEGIFLYCRPRPKSLQICHVKQKSYAVDRRLWYRALSCYQYGFHKVRASKAYIGDTGFCKAINRNFACSPMIYALLSNSTSTELLNKIKINSDNNDSILQGVQYSLYHGLESETVRLIMYFYITGCICRWEICVLWLLELVLRIKMAVVLLDWFPSQACIGIQEF